MIFQEATQLLLCVKKICEHARVGLAVLLQPAFEACRNPGRQRSEWLALFQAMTIFCFPFPVTYLLLGTAAVYLFLALIVWLHHARSLSLSLHRSFYMSVCLPVSIFISLSISLSFQHSTKPLPEHDAHSIRLVFSSSCALRTATSWSRVRR